MPIFFIAEPQKTGRISFEIVALRRCGSTSLALMFVYPVSAESASKSRSINGSENIARFSRSSALEGMRWDAIGCKLGRMPEDDMDSELSGKG